MASRALPRFKQIEVTRASRGVEAAGLKIRCVTVGVDGQIIMDIAGGTPLETMTPREKWKANKHAL